MTKETLREHDARVLAAPWQPPTGTRPTTMDEFLLDLEDLFLPGTGGQEPRLDDPDYEAKCKAWNAAGGFGQPRRGLMAEDIGSFFGANPNADDPAPEFTLFDGEGHVVMRGQYARSRMGPTVYRALRNLLDAIDPLPAYTGDDLRHQKARDEAEIRTERREKRRVRETRRQGTGRRRAR